MAWWETLFQRKSRYQREMAFAEDGFRRDLNRQAESEAARNSKIEALKAAHEQSLVACRMKYDIELREFEDFTTHTMQGDPEAVIAYFTIVLEQSTYPDGFPQEFGSQRAAMVPTHMISVRISLLN